MGSNDFYPEERPEHLIYVEPFEIDATPVTNAQFAEFVATTGYITTAELPIEGYDGLAQELRVPGSIVFTPSEGPVDLRDWRQWWRWVTGANWRHPGGPDTSIDGLENYPVVQVSFFDATEYARWAQKRLATEAEFEYAAHAGATTTYPWGDERDPDGRYMANTWRGSFPYENTADDGWPSTSPVGSFPPNAYGLWDMIGNVWEWTSSYYTERHQPTDTGPTDGCSTRSTGAACCAPNNRDLALESAEPGTGIARRVIKGGSHLCAPEYCLRYRPAARSAQAEDSSTNHIGFRCLRNI